MIGTEMANDWVSIHQIVDWRCMGEQAASKITMFTDPVQKNLWGESMKYVRQ